MGDVPAAARAPGSVQEVVRSERLAPLADLSGELLRAPSPRHLGSGDRARWWPLEERFTLGGWGRVAALKLKGTRLDASGADRLFRRERPHLGVDDHGALTLIVQDPAPWGGMYLRRALAEFTNSMSLVGSGRRSVLPVAVFTLGESADHTEPLGVVALGCPVADDRRIAHFGRVDLPFVAGTAESFGAALRGFHDAGLFRINGHPNNHYVDEGQVFLSDLDSSLRLRDVPPARAAVELARDVAGSLFWWTYWLATAMGDLEEVIRRSADVTAALLASYLHDGGPGEVSAAISAATAILEESLRDSRWPESVDRLDRRRYEILARLVDQCLGPLSVTRLGVAWPVHDRALLDASVTEIVRNGLALMEPFARDG